MSIPIGARLTAIQSQNVALLLQDLTTAMSAPHAYMHPMILDQPLADGTTRRLCVVWARWRECPEHARAEVVRVAAQAVFGDTYLSTLKSTLALSAADAAAMGLLPFEVLPEAKQNATAKIPQSQSRELLMGAGAAPLVPGGPMVLRLATRRACEAAITEMQKRLPGSQWTILEHVPRRKS